MSHVAAEVKPTCADHYHQTLRLLDLFFRLTAIPLAVASLWVMVKTKQDNDVYGKVEFSNITGLKYLVCTNAISAGYALVASILRYRGCFNSDWFFFVLDQVVAYLMVTSGSAVAEVLYLGHEGDSAISWSEVCSSYGMFCNKVKVSLALHFTALFCFIALSLSSACRLFSKFEPPSFPSEEVGGQGD